MAKTVVGLFNSTTEAQNIKHELVNEGYAAENIRVVANEQNTGTTGGYASGAGQGSSASQSTGVMASIKNFFGSFTDADESDRNYYSEGVSRGGAILSATVPDDRANALADRLEQYGARDVDAQGSSAVSGTATRTGTVNTGATNRSTAEEAAIPVVEEELQVGKRQVRRGGVRVYSHLVETPVEENVQLREEHVRVQRNTVNRPATEADFQAVKGNAIELTETAEEAVVSKQARVVEEISVGKDVTQRTETVRDTVRHTEVEVENTTPDQAKRKATSK
jgi:uncharacterized protein (TIGR02271 family)